MKALAVLGVGLLLSACALSEGTVSIDYRAQGGVQPRDGAGAIAVNVSAVDERSEHRSKVSAKVNAYGMEMAAIRSDRDVLEIVKEAVETELSARGYRLGEGDAALDLHLIRFYNRHSSGAFTGDARAEVIFDVAVLGGGEEPLFQRRIHGTGDNKDIMVLGSDNAEEALERALADAVQQLFGYQGFFKALDGASRAS